MRRRKSEPLIAMMALIFMIKLTIDGEAKVTAEGPLTIDAEG